MWHTLDAAAAAVHLAATSTGLAAAEAAQRLTTHGPNELHVQARESAWRTLAAQFQNVLIVILLCATVISGFLGHTLEAVAITVIVLFAVLLGFVQEYRASRALDALREMAAPAAHVLRDGEEVTVPARDVVPGDVVLLRTGDRVPADLRLIEAVNLAVDEAALTGESTPAQKVTGAIGTSTLPLGDRRNMAYAGTMAVHGRGQGLVVATGMATEFGHIARLVESVESSRTPLQINLDRLGATLGKAAMAVVALVVVVGLARGLPVIDMFMFGIALAVAVVPEALPAVVTISLAIGVRRMVKRRALVRRLPIVETLGSTSVICSDKTGTLTKNEMTVRHLWLDERLIDVTGAGYETAGEFRDADRRIDVTDRVQALATAAVLASDARLTTAGGRTRRHGRSHRGRAGRPRHQGRPRPGRSQPPPRARRRDPVHVGTAADDDPARDGGRHRGLLEGRDRGHPGRLRQCLAGRRPGAARRRSPRGDPRHRATTGWQRPARPGGRDEARGQARGRRGRHDAARAGRDDGPAPAGGAWRGPHVRRGRHPHGDDHGRSSADRELRRRASSGFSAATASSRASISTR